MAPPTPLQPADHNNAETFDDRSRLIRRTVAGNDEMSKQPAGMIGVTQVLELTRVASDRPSMLQSCHSDVEKRCSLG
jgi:hypothetical protein